jgi:hypothetical protein
VKVELLSNHPRQWTWKVCKDGTHSTVVAAKATLSCAESAWEAGRKALKALEQNIAVTVHGDAATLDGEVITERERGEIARTRIDGRRRGAPPSARQQADEVYRLKSEGLRTNDIAARLGVGLSSVYKVLQRGDLIVGKSGMEIAQSRSAPPPD